MLKNIDRTRLETLIKLLGRVEYRGVEPSIILESILLKIGDSLEEDICSPLDLSETEIENILIFLDRSFYRGQQEIYDFIALRRILENSEGTYTSNIPEAVLNIFKQDGYYEVWNK